MLSVFPAAALAQSNTPQGSAAPPVGVVETVPKCGADCVRANTEKAAQACARPIEAQAPIDFDWMTRPFTGLFQEADPSDDKTAVVVYRGDSIRFLTPQKEWVRVTFECAFDAEKGQLVGVRVHPGRIGRPLPQQVVAAPRPAPTGKQVPKNAPPKAPQGAQTTVPPGKINGKDLAAALTNAMQAKQLQKKPKTIQIGETSPIEVDQVDPAGIQ
jgi:hypothetical protein